MHYGFIRNEKEAMAYFTDCQLATVSHMAMQKPRSKGEYNRQISLAQKMVDQCKRFEIVDDENRMKDVLEMGTVEAWAKQFEKN